MDATKEGKKRHCLHTYKQVNFRIRRDSELYKAVTEYLNDGETSLNLLVTRALCEYLKCKLPHRQYTTYKRKRII